MDEKKLFKNGEFEIIEECDLVDENEQEQEEGYEDDRDREN